MILKFIIIIFISFNTTKVSWSCVDIVENQSEDSLLNYILSLNIKRSLFAYWKVISPSILDSKIGGKLLMASFGSSLRKSKMSKSLVSVKSKRNKKMKKSMKLSKSKLLINLNICITKEKKLRRSFQNKNSCS